MGIHTNLENDSLAFYPDESYLIMRIQITSPENYPTAELLFEEINKIQIANGYAPSKY